MADPSSFCKVWFARLTYSQTCYKLQTELQACLHGVKWLGNCSTNTSCMHVCNQRWHESCLEPIPPHLHWLRTSNCTCNPITNIVSQSVRAVGRHHHLYMTHMLFSLGTIHNRWLNDCPIVSWELASYPGHSWNRNLWTAYIEDSRIQQTWLSRALKMRLLDLIQTWSFDLELLQGNLIFGSFQAAPGLVSNPDLVFKTPNQGTLCNVLAMVWNTPSFPGRSASSFLIACRQEWPGNKAYKHSRLEE